MSGRLDVLAYPSATASQFVVFIAAMLTAGAFIGGWLHNQVEGDDWQRAVTQCIAERRTDAGGSSTSTDVLARIAAQDRCRAGAERHRAAYALGGAGAAALVGVVLMLVAPEVVRGQRRLRPVGAGLIAMTARAETLARQAGIGRTPVMMVGPATLRDAFSYGVPGRYRIAVPPAVAVRWSDASLFDPVVRHELAHVRHHDVPCAWLARSVWYALAPLLLLPVAWAALSGDASLLANYLWRAAVLALVVQLVSTALLRARELDADARAAQWGAAEPLERIVRASREIAGRPWYRRALARHPSTARRLAVLDRPDRLADVGLLEGLTPAFLAGLSIPLIVAVLTPLVAGSDHGALPAIAAACVAGTLLAGSVGLSLGRAALVGRLGERPATPAGSAFGVALGLVAGHGVSLSQTAANTGDALGAPVWILLTSLIGGGGVILCSGLAELWADAAPAFRRPRASWTSLLVVQSLLFSALLWIATSLEGDVGAGWAATREWLTFGAASATVIVAFVVVCISAACALLASRSDARAPGWLLANGASATWPLALSRGRREVIVCGLTSGSVAAGALVATRVLDDLASVDDKLAHLVFVRWAAAGAAAAAAIALLLRHRHAGAGGALVAASVACVVAVGAWLAANAALGNGLDLGWIGMVAKPSFALALLAVACVAPVALVPGRLLRAVPVALLVSIVLTGVLTVERDHLHSPSAMAAGLGSLEAAADEADDMLLPPAEDYLASTAIAIQAARSAIYRAIAEIEAAPMSRDARLQAEVILPLRATLEFAHGARPRGSAVAVHASAVQALESLLASSEAYARALAANRAGSLPAARRALERARRLARITDHSWTKWEAGLQRLTTTAGG